MHMKLEGAAVAELIGTAGLLLIAVTAIRLTAPGGPLAALDRLPAGRTLVIGVGLGSEVALFGLTPLGRLSGAQLNPAVTLLLWFRRAIGRRAAILYVFAQLAGSIVGVGIARWLWGPIVGRPQVRYGLIQPEHGLSLLVTSAGEFAMTCALLVTVLVILRRGAPRWGALVLFVVIAVMIWLGGPWTGASFNPARNFAPALFSNNWRFHPAYLLVPMIASIAVFGAMRAAERSRRCIRRLGKGDPSNRSGDAVHRGEPIRPARP
jgi:aquaporin Z